MSPTLRAQTLPVIDARPDARAAFIRRTYGHLAAAIAAFVALEAVILQTRIAEHMMAIILGNAYGWLMFLGIFIVCGWLARGLAARVDSVPLQYLGLGLYIGAEALLFAPMLYIAVFYSSPIVLPTATILTGLLFAGLTAVVVTTRKDFSSLRGILTIGGFIAIGLIVCGVIFGFELGLWFSAAMVALAGAAILYDTSKIMYHYSTDQHVAASLQLFASVALMFWYILRIVMRMSRR